MITITIGDAEYTLSTKLNVARRIESAFRDSLPSVFQNIGNMAVPDQIKIIAIAADQQDNKAFAESIYDSWDFSDLTFAVQEVVANIMFSGTPEETEAKLAKFPVSDAEKNSLRALLNLPIPATPPAAPSTGNT